MRLVSDNKPMRAGQGRLRGGQLVAICPDGKLAASPDSRRLTRVLQSPLCLPPPHGAGVAVAARDLDLDLEGEVELNLRDLHGA